MKYLKNFNKTITLILSVAIYTLVILAIVFAFTKEFFAGDDSTYVVTSYTMITGKPNTFTITGIFDFVDTFISYATKNTEIKFSIIAYSDELILGARKLKTFAIIILVIEGLFILSQCFNFRHYGKVICSILAIVALIIFKNTAIDTFTSTYLLTSVTKLYKLEIVLWSISLFLSIILVVYKILLKKVKE